jgi:hypothetical protein
MFGKGVYLCVDRVRYIDDYIGNIRTPEKDVLNFVTLDATDELLGEMQVIPSIWVHRVLDRNSNIAMVAVLETVNSVLVVSEYDFRSIFA